jgi:16S rRNA (adenine1518-N6/adenine1519-N6)-dimethyltransferase
MSPNTVLEIGPGDGRLSVRILESIPRGSFTVVELGDDMISKLTQRLKSHEGIDEGSVNIVRGDARKVSINFNDFDVIIGNLPYSISSPFLKRLVSTEVSPTWRKAVFLVQDEFALKTASMTKKKTPSFSGKHGVVTVMVGCVADVSVVGPLVPPSAFDPPPKVNSRILQLDLLSSPPLIDPKHNQEFKHFLQIVFKAKRRSVKKNLLSNAVLVRMNSDYEPTLVSLLSTFVELGSIASKRALDVSPSEYSQLFNKLVGAGMKFPNISSSINDSLEEEEEEDDDD